MQTLLVGGPLDGKVANVPPEFAVLDTPDGRYVRQALSANVTVFGFVGAASPKPNRWARKKRPNPFPTVSG